MLYKFAAYSGVLAFLLAGGKRDAPHHRGRPTPDTWRPERRRSLYRGDGGALRGETGFNPESRPASPPRAPTCAPSRSCRRR